MKTFKSIIKWVLLTGIVMGFIFAGGQRPDGSADIIWSFGWLGFSTICYQLVKHIAPNIFS